MLQKNTTGILFISVCIVAVCGILYELLISSISSYFLGSSILHFSITIGLFLSFMGLGAYLSRFLSDEFLLDYFILTEILLGVIGGLSGALLYTTYTFTENYYLVAFLLISMIGSLIGLEIPILTRIVHRYFDLKDTLAQVLSFDYLGALIASIVFPLFLLPYFGIMRTSFFVGLLNLSVSIFNLIVFKDSLRYFRVQLGIAFAATSLFLFGFYYSFSISGFLEQLLYQDEIIYSEQSPYQRIVLTQWNDDTRLYINGNLQFCSVDEYRYHETLVHVPMSLHPAPENILILGGGDGLAVREIMKYNTVKKIDLVDLDKLITDLAQENRTLKELNKSALTESVVNIYNEDAYQFVEKSNTLYSVIIIDLPDPNEVSLGKLYSKEFYTLLNKRLAADGILITQSTSPFFARKVFWCINETLQTVFPTVMPVTVNVPSFGQWGFNMALKYKLDSQNLIQKVQRKIEQAGETKDFKYISGEIVPTLFIFDKDMERLEVEYNTLNNQKIIQYYEEGWQNFSN